MKGTQIYELYSSVTPEDVEWFWYPYIPYGKLTLLQGDPGDGKSTCMIHLAACLSTGGILPDGTQLDQSQTVIYQCAEDSLNDTVKPRLMKAGADCEKIAFITDDEMSLSLNDWRIEETIQAIHARLLILDPIQAFISQDTDMQNAAKMRNIMSRLGSIAEKYHCAVVLIGHMTKATGGKELYRGLGSIDIAAIARSVLMITRNKSMPEVRYLSQIKNSLAPEGDPFSFILDADNGFQWLGKCKILDNEEVEDEQSCKKKKITRAQELLQIMLDTEDMPSKEIIEKFSRLSISERTVRSAMQEMGVKAYRKNNAWYWHLEG